MDLAVISTYARAGLPDFCLKSAAEEIVRYAPCPVLLVRDQERNIFRELQLAHDPPKSRNQKHARGLILVNAAIGSLRVVSATAEVRPPGREDTCDR